VDTERGIRPPGHRLPAETTLGPVRLQVADLERAVGYYELVIGLGIVEAEGGVARMGSVEEGTVLVELRERPGAEPVPRNGRVGLYHFAILLPDRASLGRFSAHLHELGLRPGAADHRVSEALYLHDPDGLGIEVYADRGRDAWVYRGPELILATDPLDRDSLEAAGNGARWEGVPAGTVMGHVHLHVGDLEVAKAHYHAALGLDAMMWSYPSALFLAAGGYHHHLGLNTWSTNPPADEADARLVEWEMVVPNEADARATAESLRAAGCPVAEAGAGWTAPDPWGTVLRIRS
jgi:catechol 2,3-dioxygenase